MQTKQLSLCVFFVSQNVYTVNNTIEPKIQVACSYEPPDQCKCFEPPSCCERVRGETQRLTQSVYISIQRSFCIISFLCSFYHPQLSSLYCPSIFSHPGVPVNTDTSCPTNTPINTSPSGTNPLPSTTPTLGDSSATRQAAVGAPVMLVALLLTALLLRNQTINLFNV